MKPQGHRKIFSRNRILLLLFFILFPLLSSLVLAPLLPHSIAGFIFRSDRATQAPLGTPYTINETNSSDFIRSQTNIPIPGMSGAYFEVINGVDGDIVVVTAWNSTHYGRTNTALVGDMENVNVTINKTRGPELNVTITYPPDDTVFYTSSSHNVSVRIKVLGGDGIKCNTTISFSNESVVNISAKEFATHGLGSPSRGTVLTTFWNISANSAGSSNIMVTGRCSNDGIYLEADKPKIIYNVSVKDISPPTVFLISPANRSAAKSSNNVMFHYNVSDISDILNCKLIINKKVNKTNSTPIVKNKRLNISQSLANGRYNWSVNCTDFYSNVGTGGTFRLNVSVYFPHVQGVRVTSPVSLNSGGTVYVQCNATVVDGNGVADLLVVNATFFDSTVSSARGQNDNNYHYSDSNCASVKNSSNATNVSCVFELYYYANSGKWDCNVTAYDKNNLTNLSNASTLVEEIYAIGVDSFIDFGGVGTGEVSPDVNVTLHNFGNKDINVSVEGYGKERHDNLSMICRNGGNLSVFQERYSSIGQEDFSDMNNLSAYPATIKNFELAQRTNDNIYTDDSAETFWKLGIPYGLKGSCNGTTIFGIVLP